MAGKLILLWLAAFPLMGSPGPATISLAGIGTAYGFRNGLAYLAGIVLGTFSVLVMVASGVTATILTIPTLVTALTALAALYILYLAWKIASAPIGIKQGSTGKAPSIGSGFLLAIANPKAFAAIGAVYSSHSIVNNNLVRDNIVKIAALTLVIVVVNLAWLAFGSTFSKLLNDPKLGKLVNYVFAAMLLLSVAMALMTV